MLQQGLRGGGAGFAPRLASPRPGCERCKAARPESPPRNSSKTTLAAAWAGNEWREGGAAQSPSRCCSFWACWAARASEALSRPAPHIILLAPAADGRPARAARRPSPSPLREQQHPHTAMQPSLARADQTDNPAAPNRSSGFLELSNPQPPESATQASSAVTSVHLHANVQTSTWGANPVDAWERGMGWDGVRCGAT